MKRQQFVIAILLIIISLAVISQLLPIFNNFYSRISKSQQTRVDVSNLSPLNREDLYRTIGDKTWKLSVLQTDSKIVKPIVNSEPRLWMSDERVISFDLGCNITYTLTDTGTEQEWNKYFLAENGQVEIISRHIGSRQTFCANKAHEWESKVVAPEVGKNGQFYLQDDKLILNFTDKDTYFIFHK